jgi:hypothetical protein
MRTSQTLALLGVLAVAPVAKAAGAGGDVVATPEPATAPASDSLPWLGLMADAGVPDGVQGSLVLRPMKWLRTSVGGGYNMISKGVRAGVSILPFGRGPSATLEAGRFFEGNANTAGSKYIAGYSDANPLSPALDRIGYDYANAHLGLDFGYKRVTFYIHGGMTYMRGKVHNLGSLFNKNPAINGTDENGLSVTVSDVSYTVIAPSAKLGLIVYLW